MSGELNLTIVLTAYANAYCHDCLSPEEERLLADHPMYQAVGSLQFGDAQRLPPAEAAHDWLESLRRLNTRRLWLEPVETPGPLAPAMAAAFANANPTVILVACDAPHVLLPRWSWVEDSWQVVFNHVPLTKVPAAPVVNVSRASDELRRRLEEASAFAVAQDQPYWDSYLPTASAILDEAEHRSDRLTACGYTAAAHRLVSAASAAYVFGGMSTWNDMWFTDKAVMQEYNEITDAFYHAVMNAYLVAVNSFDPTTSL